jgi:hypothetical protein
MLSKINVCPIIVDHFSTLRDSAQPRLLKRDIFLFYVVPLVAGIVLGVLDVRIPGPVIDYLLLGITLIIPLLLNVVMLIYSIKQQATSTVAKPESAATSGKNRIAAYQLLQEIYKNLSYSILVASVAMILLGVAKFLDPQFGVGTIATRADIAERIAVDVLFGTLFFLLIHLFLTGMMILKRTHVLLAFELTD